MNTPELDILVICAHPDDAELGCGGTLIKHAKMGHKVGIIDMTMGEMGTRGTPELRIKESLDAAKILGLTIRENLKLPDTKLKVTEEFQLKIIEKIRKYRPKIIITNAPNDRHPDHGNGAELVISSAWLSGLTKLETIGEDGLPQKAFRTEKVYQFIQYKLFEPDFVVDVSKYTQQKMDAIMCYKSQFYDPNSTEPETLIASPAFLESNKARNYMMGNFAMIEEGEGFLSKFTPAVDHLFNLI